MGKDACIRIDIAEYFSHSSHNMRLNNSEKKRFILIMQRDWQRVKELWNKNNPNNRIEINAPMPDYSNLNST